MVGGQQTIAMENDDPSPTYTTGRRPPIFRRDRHLASALTRGEIDYLLSQWNNPRGLKKEHHLLKRDTKNVTFLPSDQYIHWALLHISSSPPLPRYTEQLLRHMKIATGATNLGHVNYAKFKPTLRPPQATPLLSLVFSLKKTLAIVTDSITFSQRFKQDYKFFGCKATCYGNLHVVWISIRSLCVPHNA